MPDQATTVIAPQQQIHAIEFKHPDRSAATIDLLRGRVRRLPDRIKTGDNLLALKAAGI